MKYLVFALALLLPNIAASATKTITIKSGKMDLEGPKGVEYCAFGNCYIPSDSMKIGYFITFDLDALPFALENSEILVEYSYNRIEFSQRSPSGTKELEISPGVGEQTAPGFPVLAFYGSSIEEGGSARFAFDGMGRVASYGVGHAGDPEGFSMSGERVNGAYETSASYGSYYSFGRTRVRYSNEVTGLWVVAPVPLPAAGGFALLGLLALAGLSRFRRSDTDQAT